MSATIDIEALRTRSAVVMMMSTSQMLGKEILCSSITTIAHTLSGTLGAVVKFVYHEDQFKHLATHLEELNLETDIALLDVVVFYPIQPCGRKLYQHRVHERAKYERYQPTRDGRRQHAVPLVPAVVSCFGVLNETCAVYFDGVERTARGRGKPFVPRTGGPRGLDELVSLMAILEAASIVTDVYSQRLSRDVLH